MADNETIADIIAEMRDWLGDANSYDLRSLADRLEAVHKRECATAEKSSTVGNAAKMREALEHVAKLAREFAVGNYYVSDFPKMLLDAIQPALAAPPRNCDVGTAGEQFERWRALCDKYDADCKGCPCDDGRTCSLAYCFARWAQMPYEEGEIR